MKLRAKKNMIKSFSKHLRKCSGAFLILLLACIVLAHSTKVNANSYATGKKLYVSGKFSDAKKALIAASKKKTSSTQLADIYRLLGIIDFTAGDKNSAQKAFSISKRLNPRGKINPAEVLDSKVIAFYNGVGTAQARSGTTASSASRTRQVPKRATRSRSSGIHPNAAQVKKNLTYLYIDSKVSGASVILDGIISGTVNTNIESEPGTQTLEIKKSGYFNYKSKVMIKPKQLNKITINLKRMPTAKEIAAAKAAKAAKAKAKIAAAKAQKKAALLARKKAQAKARAQAARANTLAQKKRAKSTRAAGVQNSRGQSKDMFKQSEPVYANPSNLPPAYGGQYNPAPVPSYAPPPNYPQYQQPAYAPPAPYPAYQAPVAPVYQQPYAQPYVQPAPVAPVPPPTTVDPYLMEPQTFDDLSKVSKKRRASGKKKRSKTNYATAWMPFGVGQYVHNKPVIGSLFLASQAGALALWYVFGDEAESALSSGKTQIAQLEQEIETLSGPEKELKTQELDKFIADTAAYVKEKESHSQYAMFGFFGLWTAGAAEAYISGPAAPKSSGGWSMDERGTYSQDVAEWNQDENYDENYDENIETDKIGSMVKNFTSNYYEPTYHFKFAPMRQQTNLQNSTRLGLVLEANF